MAAKKHPPLVQDFLDQAKQALASQARGFGVTMYAPAGMDKLAPETMAKLKAAGITVDVGTNRTSGFDWGTTAAPKWSGYAATGAAAFRGGPAVGSTAMENFTAAGGKVKGTGIKATATLPDLTSIKALGLQNLTTKKGKKVITKGKAFGG